MKNIMVCVTRQKNCQKLIDYGKSIQLEGDTLHIIHVEKKDYNFLGDSEEGRALEFLFEKAHEVGAELTVLKSDDVVRTLIKIMEDRNIDKVIIGETKEQHKEKGFMERLKRAVPGGAEILVV